jgi:hypothetical protein
VESRSTPATLASARGNYLRALGERPKKSELQRALKDALKNHNATLAATIKTQIADVDSSILQASVDQKTANDNVEQRKVFDARRKDFMDAAHRAAGADLPTASP